MVPLVGTVREFDAQAAVNRGVAAQVFAERGAELPYLLGTMIETPRAALVADSIARQAEFFSFGTNDLTQMTLGFSRDDAGRFLPGYLQQGIYERDPFRSIDVNGVGQFVQMAVQKGRAVRADLELGVCGEHGGDPASVAFFHRAGLDYVSCSPFRVPIARLAAAQAAQAALGPWRCRGAAACRAWRCGRDAIAGSATLIPRGRTMDLQCPSSSSTSGESVVRATATLDLASGEIRSVQYQDYDLETLGLPALQEDYEFTCGMLSNAGRDVEFRVEVDALSGKYSITPSELLELKGRAAKLFTQAPPSRK
jgi:hypothetical protein